MSVLLSRDWRKMALFCRCVCGDGIHVKIEKEDGYAFIPRLEKSLKKSKKSP